MYRQLTEYEIKTLADQVCRCDDWSHIEVAEGFTPEYIRNSNFSGDVQIGVFEKDVTFFGGVKKHTGIFNATIHNCRIGNNVYIGQIRNYTSHGQVLCTLYSNPVSSIAAWQVSGAATWQGR